MVDYLLLGLCRQSIPRLCNVLLIPLISDDALRPIQHPPRIQLPKVPLPLLRRLRQLADDEATVLDQSLRRAREEGRNEYVLALTR